MRGIFDFIHGSRTMSMIIRSYTKTMTTDNTDGAQPPPQRDAKNILVVDDNEDAANSMTTLLRALGYNAAALYGAEEVVPYLHAHHDIDTIVLDVGMPITDGYQLVRILRDKGYRTQRIIALTGYGLEKDKEKARAAGFDAHLTKPVGISELRAALGRS